MSLGVRSVSGGCRLPLSVYCLSSFWISGGCRTFARVGAFYSSLAVALYPRATEDTALAVAEDEKAGMREAVRRVIEHLVARVEHATAMAERPHAVEDVLERRPMCVSVFFVLFLTKHKAQCFVHVFW